MNKIKMKARAGVTLVELLVVMLIVAILAVGLLPLLKPYIEQSKYAADVLPALGSVQTKIDLYQYERDRLPGANITTDANSGAKTEDTSSYDNQEWGWKYDAQESNERHKVYAEAEFTGGTGEKIVDLAQTRHISNYIDVTWQQLVGKRMNPSHFKYHILKGLGAAKYGYAIGVFGDGEGLAIGTGYAILILVDTENKEKVVATWERYTPKSDEPVRFQAMTTAPDINGPDKAVCYLPATASFADADLNADAWASLLGNLKTGGWSFNTDDSVD